MNEIVPVKQTGLPHQAARGSWICPLLIVMVSMVAGRTGSRLIVELFALVLILVGLVLAVIAFSGIRKYGCRGILAQAIAGFLINGLLAAIFVTNFLAARTRHAL